MMLTSAPVVCRVSMRRDCAAAHRDSDFFGHYFAGLVVNLAAIPVMTVVQIACMTAVALSWRRRPNRCVPGWVVHIAVEVLIGSATLVDWCPRVTRRVAPPHGRHHRWLDHAALMAAPAPCLRHPEAPTRSAAAMPPRGAWIVAATAISFATPEQPLRVTFCMLARETQPHFLMAGT